MELKELRHFARVARAGSFSRAAQELRLAQPALSRQIAKLERELGVPLLARHGRGVRLTTAGSMLLERAEAIAHLVRQTGDDIREDRAPAGGRVTVGVPPAAGRLLIPPLVRHFQAERPQTSLHIREGVTSTLQEWLLDKRLDVAVLHNPPPLDALNIRPILQERMWLIGPRAGSSDAERARTYRIRDLGDLPLILPSLAHNNRRLVEQAALEHGVRLRIKIEIDSVAFAKAMVEDGLGYTILTYAAVEEEVAQGRLTAFPIMRPVLSTRVTLVTLAGALPRLTEETSATLFDIAHELVRGRRWSGSQWIAA